MPQPDKNFSEVWRRAILIFVCLSVWTLTAAASLRYTERQLDAFAARIGRTFWLVADNQRTPSFLSTPAPNAASFRAQAHDSFEVLDLVNRHGANPYYKVKFASGKDGYILPEDFQQELNLTILTVDPQANEKKKAAAAAEEDKKRIEWIQTQPWSQAVKEQAMQRRPVPGMNIGEVKKLLGDPARATKIRNAQKIAEEHWFYADGAMLVFQNGLLTRIEAKKQETEKGH